MGANPFHPINSNNTIHPDKKMYCILLSAHFRFLNLRANMGNLETSNPLKKMVSIMISHGVSISQGAQEYAMPVQKMALAGVDKPMKESF
jgi:hypothetical protein